MSERDEDVGSFPSGRDPDDVSDLIMDIRSQLNETNQLLGDVVSALGNILASLDRGRPDERPVPCASGGTGCRTMNRPNPPPQPDETYLERLLSTPGGKETKLEVVWPRSKAPQEWVRAVVRYADDEGLAARIAAGCLCGREIVTRKIADGSEFYTCSGVTQFPSCDHRPAVYPETRKFLINLPPKTG